MDNNTPNQQKPVNPVNQLLETVVRHGACIGCGACASLPRSPLHMTWSEEGQYVAALQETPGAIFQGDPRQACPFAASGQDEDTIGKALYGQVDSIQHDPHVGYNLGCYAGSVREGTYRTRGSSGGMGTWLAAQLLKEQLADGVIHVKPDGQPKPGKTEPVLFSYQVSHTVEELAGGAKSKYYPIELSQVIDHVRHHSGRYVLIGIPCFIKAIRLLAQQDAVIRERICWTIGLVCGHLKSDGFAKSLAWQMGIKPADLQAIDFRVKLEQQKASHYGVEAKGTIDGQAVTKSAANKSLYVASWGYGLFKYPACDLCDDVVAETADVSIGDAWLPDYVSDALGTNIVIVRHPTIARLLADRREALQLASLNLDQIVTSQAGGFRHRREGLAYRLWLLDQAHEWRPQKRVQPADRLDKKRKLIYKQRGVLTRESHKAFQMALAADRFQTFTDQMDPHLAAYNRLFERSLASRIWQRIRAKIKIKSGAVKK